MSLDRSRSVSRHRRLTIAVLVPVLLVLLAPLSARALDILDDRPEGTKQYLVQLSGLTGKRSFFGAKALLLIGPAPEGHANAYTITMSGYPRDNEDNTFVWISDNTRMEDLSTKVIMSIADSSPKQPEIFFYHLSPILYKLSTTTQHDKEDIKEAKKRALPTRIMAKAGALSLNFLGRSVSGEVWITGYDNIGHESVRYQAHLEGELTSGLKSKTRIWKRD